MLFSKSLYIKNFLSFEEETLNIQVGQTTCIMGKNLTEDNQQSNGSGKSALQAAIEYSYNGSASRKVTKNKLVRRGCKEAIIIHEVFNPQSNETLRIERIIPLKGSEKVFVFLNDKEVEIATTKDANDWINNYIGVTKEDISNYFIPNEVNYVSFFNSPDTKKKELISRFSNADIVDSVFEKVQKDINTLQKDINNKEKEVDKLEGRIEQLNIDLQTELSKDYAKEKEAKINSLKSSMFDYEQEIKNNNVKLVDLRASNGFLNNNIISKRKTSLKRLELYLNDYIKSSPDFESEYDGINKDLSTLKTKEDKAEKIETEVKEDIQAANKDISSMEIVLAGKVECPKCSHEFNPKSDITIEQAKKEIKGFKEEIEEYKEDLSKVEKLLTRLGSQRIEVKHRGGEINERQIVFDKKKRKIEKVVKLVVKSIDRIKSDIDKYSKDIKEIELDNEYNEQQIEKSKKRIKEISESKDESKDKEIKKTILSIEKEISEKKEEITSIINKQESVTEWIINFKAFKTYLANKKLKVIQDMINKYLTDMNCDYKLKLEGYKQLANGKDVREKITPYIFKDGEMCDYGEFSKGERARIDFATLLTLQTLVNDNCEKGGLELLFLDEIGEGLDTEGLSSLLKSFENTGKTVFITSHVTNENIDSNILMIEKVNGISKIVKN